MRRIDAVGEEVPDRGGVPVIREGAFPTLVRVDDVERRGCSGHHSGLNDEPLAFEVRAQHGALFVVADGGNVVDVGVSAGEPFEVDRGVGRVAGVAERHDPVVDPGQLDHAFADDGDPDHAGAPSDT